MQILFAFIQLASFLVKTPVAPEIEGCTWPQNALTTQGVAQFNGINDATDFLYDIGTIVMRSCPAQCGSPNGDLRHNCFNYIPDRTWRCVKKEKRGKSFHYWTRITANTIANGSQKDAFFTAGHSIPKKIAKRFLCRPERVVTDPMIDCGPIPTIMSKFAANTVYSADMSTVMCLNDTQRIGNFINKSSKWQLNMACKTKKKWNGVFKWVNVGATGKYWPIRATTGSLNFRYHCR